MHWLREITKAKLCQAKTFFNHIFLLKKIKKVGKAKFGQVRAILDKFRQLWASLVNLGQVRTRQQIRKMEKRGRKTKKKE